jgi:hypothetical protein
MGDRAADLAISAPLPSDVLAGDEPVRYGWGRAWSAYSCRTVVDLEVRRELESRVVSVTLIERRAAL